MILREIQEMLGFELLPPRGRIFNILPISRIETDQLKSDAVNRWGFMKCLTEIPAVADNKYHPGQDCCSSFREDIFHQISHTNFIHLC
jgi:hypothetical protein